MRQKTEIVERNAASPEPPHAHYDAVFKSRKLTLTAWLATTALLTLSMIFWETRGAVWTSWDFSIMEFISQHVRGNRQLLPEARFERAWSLKDVFGILVIMSLILGFAAALKKARLFLLAGAMIPCALAAFAALEFFRSALFPIVCLGGSFLFMFCFLLIVRKIAIAQEQAFVLGIIGKRAPDHAIAQIIAAPEQLCLEGEEKDLTIMCVEVIGFTTIVEQTPRHVVKKVLNDYFSEMTDIVIAAGGFVDKFVGGKFTTEFGMLVADENHAEQAVVAALKMQRRLLDLHKQWTRQGLPRLQCRIGIHTGPVLAGNMGAHEIIAYTVLGEAAEFASRLARMNEIYDTTLLVSENTHAHLSAQTFRVRLVDKIKTRPECAATTIHEIYGDLATYRSTRATAYYQAYQRALEFYLQRDFARAKEKCREALHHIPDDAAATLLNLRLDRLLLRGVPDDWEGAVLLRDLFTANLSS